MASNRLTRLTLMVTISILLLVLLYLVTAYLYRANLDVGIYPHLGTRILNGERPYVDFFEINLPTIHYLNVLPAFLSDITGLNEFLLIHILVWILIVWACVATYQITATNTPTLDALRWLQYVLPITLVIISIFSWFSQSYAQRELIFVAMTMPWVVLRFLRWELLVKEARWSFVIIGVIAAIGTSIKPYFPLTIVLIEVYSLLRHRNLRPFFTRECYGFAGFTVIYLLYFVVNPDIFFGLIAQLRLTADGYSAYTNVPLRDFLRDRDFLYAIVLTFLPFTLWGMKHPLFHFSRIMGLVGISGLITVVVQAKDFGYHWIPVWFGTLGTVMVLFACIGSLQATPPRFLRGLSTRLIFVPVIVILIQTQGILRTINAAPNPYSNLETAYPTIYFTERYTNPQDSVFVLATWTGVANPYLSLLDRFNSSSYAVSHPLVMAYADNPDDRLNPNAPIPPMVQQMVDVIRDDIVEHPPLILLDRTTYEFLETHDLLLSDLILPSYAQVGDWRGRGLVAFVPLSRTPASDLTFQFGESIKLSRWLISPNDSAQPIQSCEQLSVRTLWEATDKLYTRYSLSLSLVDSDGNLVTQLDDSPSDTPTVDWREDRYYQDDRYLVIPCDLENGTYSLLMTLYDPLAPDSNLSIVASDGAAYGTYLWLRDVIITNTADANN